MFRLSIRELRRLRLIGLAGRFGRHDDVRAYTQIDCRRGQ